LIDAAAGVYRWLLKALLTSLKGGIGTPKKFHFSIMKERMREKESNRYY